MLPPSTPSLPLSVRTEPTLVDVCLGLSDAVISTSELSDLLKDFDSAAPKQKCLIEEAERIAAR